MIRVVYDYQVFSLQKYGGVSRYFANLASALSEDPKFQVRIEAGFYQNEYLASSNKYALQGIKVPYIPKVNKILMDLNHWSNQVNFKLTKPDVIHETYYRKLAGSSGKYKRVVTVHDMIDEKFNRGKGKDEFIEVKRLAIESADRIICVSQNTKKDLIEILNINPERIDVVYLGHSVTHLQQQSQIPLTNFPYLLFVGERGSYKNFSQLVKAYASSKQLSEFHIICCGLKPFNAVENNLFNELGIANKIKHIAADDALLAYLYQKASALVYPSLYEGFGIPPIEAMSLGCPVICSNTSSVPEVVADAGEYFDPHSIDSMSAAMERVLFSASRHQELVQKGIDRAKIFSWSRCAAETGKIYEQLAKL